MPADEVKATVAAVRAAAEGIQSYGRSAEQVATAIRSELKRLDAEFQMGVAATEREWQSAERAGAAEAGAARMRYERVVRAQQVFDRAAGELRSSLSSFEAGSLTRLRSAGGGISEYAAVLSSYLAKSA